MGGVREMTKMRVLFMIAPLLLISCGDGEPTTSRPPPRTRQAKNNQPVKAPIDAGSRDADHAVESADTGTVEPAKATDRAVVKARLEARGLVARARFLSGSRQVEEAIKALSDARDLDPEDPWIRNELAKACLDANNQECTLSEARAAIARSSGRASALATAYGLIGRSHEASGRTAEARQAYEKLLNLRPEADLVTKLQKLRLETDPLPPPTDKISCPLASASNLQAVAIAENTADGRGKTICPLSREPFVERDSDGFPIETHVMAAFTKHEAANVILRGYDGLGAQGTFAVILVRTSHDSSEVVVLDHGEIAEHESEIVKSLSAEIRRVTLGPSRPGLAIEVVSEGWWDVAPESTPYSFKRHELFLASRQLNKYDRLVRQVTLEKGHKGVEDCARGEWSRPVHRGGVIWLEDLDLSGVPEICQESWDQELDIASWIGRPNRSARTDASCKTWTASTLNDSKNPVPSLKLDEFDRGRSVDSVLEVSRVPAQIRAFVEDHLEDNVFVTARALELTKSGMQAMAIIASENHVKVLAVSAADNVNILDLGKIGRWRDIWATINITNPQLISVKIHARGDDLGGSVERHWLHLIAAGPGEPPRVALSEELLLEEPLDTEPCPHITETRYQREAEDGGIFISFSRTRRTGPGTHALEQWQQISCDQFQRWVKSGSPALPAPDADVPWTYEDICPIGVEQLESQRYTQGADGRFVKTSLQ